MNPRTRDKSNNLYKLLDLYNHDVNNSSENTFDVEKSILELKDCLDDLKAKWLSSCKNDNSKKNVLYNFEKKIRLNFKSQEYIEFFLTDYKFSLDNIKPLILDNKTLSNDDKRYASKQPFKRVEERKLDYYSILNGFNGFHCAQKHDYDISKKNPYEDFCREKILIDPDDPTILLIESLDIKGNIPTKIPEDLRRHLYDYISSKLYEHNQKMKRFDIDSFQNALSHSIRSAYINVCQGLHSLIHKLNTKIEEEKSLVLAGEFHEEMMNPKKKNSPKKRMYLRVHHFLESGKSEDLTKGYDIDIIKGFIQLELKNYRKAKRILEGNKRKRKKIHYFKSDYHDDLLLYEIYKKTKDYDGIDNIENGVNLFKSNLVYSVLTLKNKLEELKPSIKRFNNLENRPSKYFSLNPEIKKLHNTLLNTNIKLERLNADFPEFYSFLAGLLSLTFSNEKSKDDVAENYHLAVNKGSTNICDYLRLTHFYWELGSYEIVDEILDKTIASKITSDNFDLIYKIKAFIYLRNEEYDKARLSLLMISNK